MAEEFYIGQIFEGEYPPEAADWCNERQDAYINRIEDLNEVIRWQITAIPQPTAEDRERKFNKEFFNTSLGYIRRSVTMSDGAKKDFLSDLLPTIAIGVNSGFPVSVLAYNKPDMSEPVSDWTLYQHTETVTPQFIQECFAQLQNDFLPNK